MKSIHLKALTLLVVLAIISTLSSCGKEKALKTIFVYKCASGNTSPNTEEVTKIQNTINEYLTKKGADYKIELKFLSSSDFETKANQVKDGKIYYIPCNNDIVPEGYDVIVRSDLAKNLNWEPGRITSFDTIEKMLSEAKTKGIKYPFLTQNTALFTKLYIDDFDFFTQDSFIAVDRDSNKVVNSILTPEFSEFCKLMSRWAEKGYISSDDVNKKTPEATAKTKDWAISYWKNDENLEPEDLYGQAIETVSITHKYINSSSIFNSCFALPANSTEEETKACENFLGKVKADNELSALLSFNNNEETAKKSDIPSIQSCAFGFNFDASPVAEEYKACKKIAEEYGYILENGGTNLKEVDETIAIYQIKLDEAGYQKLLTEAKKQYDAWKK